MASGPLAMPTLGRRERKKQQMREHIAETARRLFSEGGFDGVTVAEIAAVADVSEQTVYNHFATKEDLVYWRLGTFEDEMLGTIRDRAPGETVLSAFGRFVRRPRGLLQSDDAEVHERLAALTRTIVESAPLQAREQSIIAGYTTSLAALLADESGMRPDDVEPWVAANAMLGVHRALTNYARRRIIEGARPPRLTRDFVARADRSLALLEKGLGTYMVKATP
jgi:AcrR family transcriptional regulator